MLSLPSLVFTISSVITLILIYFNAPIASLQQIAAILLFTILLTTSRFIDKRINLGNKRIWYFISLGLSSFFVQILVLATGGIFSSFLILVHLYTLGASFLLKISSSIIFLLFTLVILVANIFMTPQLLAMFKDDPGAAILYFVSFIIIIPIAQYLMYSYHLKDALFKALKDYAETGEQREKSILNNINELVIVTDKDLNILSTNEAVGQSLNIVPESYSNRPLVDLIPLKNQEGGSVSAKDLSITQLLNDKTTRIINGFFFQAPGDLKPRPISIQIRPVTNSKEEVSQIVFLITDPEKQKNLQKHSDLEEALTKQKMLSLELKNTLLKAGLGQVASKFELFNKIEADLLLAYELEDHPIQPASNPEDVAVLGKQALTSKQVLAQNLGVRLQFELPKEEIDEANILHLLDIDIASQSLPLSPFMVPIDKKWFTIAMHKLLDIGILLASERPNQLIKLLVKHNDQDNNIVDLEIIIPYRPISKQETDELFIQYYSSMATKSNLGLGSGLEGFIAKNILAQLDIPLNTQFNESTSSLIFSFNLTRTLPKTR